MFAVYVLRSSSSGKLYIGQSGNFESRLLRHQLGLARYTRGRGPWELMLTEQYSTRSEAMHREHFLKSGQGREWLKRKLNVNMEQPEVG